jgi:hypothetical protein
MPAAEVSRFALGEEIKSHIPAKDTCPMILQANNDPKSERSWAGQIQGMEVLGDTFACFDFFTGLLAAVFPSGVS